MPGSKRRVLLSWSSGKDSAWCLHVLNQQPGTEVVGLLTTFNESADRVAMHAVRRQLVEMQAESVGLPLFPVMLPWPCSNDDYEGAMKKALGSVCKSLDATTVAFGDLFLEDIRTYRVSFQRILTELKNYYQPAWDLDRGGKELVAFFDEVGFTEKEFRGRTTNRLAQLKYFMQSRGSA